MTEADELITNGELWMQEKFPFCRLMVQWLNDDQWLLMTTPFVSMRGWRALMPSVEKGGKMIYSRSEALERLRGANYSPMGVGAVTDADR